MLELDIQNQQQAVDIPAEKDLQQWATAAFLGDGNAQVSLTVVDAEESRQLNKNYRHKDKPTNVLSFPMDMPDQLAQTLDQCLLGDLVVCAAVVDEESRQQHKKTEAHWAHMLVHGMLHLQGYDHIEDDEAEKMEQLEIKILNQLGFENPYESGN